MITENYFPGMLPFLEKVLDDNKSNAKKFTDVFSATINLFELSLQIFIISSIKVYEDRFVNREEQYRKKVKAINDILKHKYIAPSLGSQTSLAKSCTYLIDESAPLTVKLMQEKLREPIVLGPIAGYLSELTRIFEALEEPQENRPVAINRESTKKELLSIMNEFVAFRNESAHLVNIGKAIEENESSLRLDIGIWRSAFLFLVEHLKPLLANEYRIKTLDKVYSVGDVKMISIKNRNFYLGSVTEDSESYRLDEWYEEQWSEKSQIIMRENTLKKEINVFPFLTLKDDKLFFYKKTTGGGYQYFSIVDDRTFRKKSNKKFNRSIFKTSSGNAQALFWTEVLPVLNLDSGIKANIPSQGNIKFVGRKKQINKIKEEIIEIPNQNGILYGPGGVGKTALLIQLTQQLFVEKNKDNILYSNIIWVSAKTNFYHWEQNATITNLQQFESLENILQIILLFFDYEDVNEYSLEELKGLVFELLEENTVLLVLDNFETINKLETDKIITFFGSDVMKHLKRLPHNFKIVLTSRELLPSGYYQMKLEGLELKESKLLMESIYERYKNSHPELSQEQYKLIHHATLGIPIVIKHCLGQIFEFQVPLSDILTGLSEQSNEVIKFSYAEILSHLRRDDCYLKILILLEILNEPISARLISLILEIDIVEINRHLPVLLNFQCVERINVGIEEKYRVSSQIGLLAKSLIKQNPEVAKFIRVNVASNLTLEKKMDYAVEELEIIEIFNGYIDGRDFAYAEYFLKGEINKRPNSVLLRFHYALFLRDKKKDFSQSIALLEILDKEIIKTEKRDANILLALVSTYTILSFPNYEKCNQLCLDLLKISPNDTIYLFVGEFFINWSNALKNRREIDPLDDIKRKNKIKELAKKAIDLIESVESRKDNHKSYYLMSMAYFNQWNTLKAKEYIGKAINLSQKDLISLRTYEKFLAIIEKFHIV
jgi:DNA replication protein DnaC